MHLPGLVVPFLSLKGCQQTFRIIHACFGHRESLVIMIPAQNRSFLSGFFIYFLKCQKKSVAFCKHGGKVDDGTEKHPCRWQIQTQSVQVGRVLPLLCAPWCWGVPNGMELAGEFGELLTKRGTSKWGNNS